MPSYNLPHFPLISPPPSSSSPSAVPLHAPIPVRPAFVPLPLPNTTPTEKGEGRPSSPGKRTRRRVDEGCGRSEVVAVGSVSEGGDAAAEKENRRSRDVELPDTPPATPPPVQLAHRRHQVRSSSRERGEASGRRHARSPSEGGHRQRCHQHEQHRRSSSISSISYPVAPLTPRPSSPPLGRLVPPPQSVTLLALRLRRAPPHPSPLARDACSSFNPPPRGRTPSPSHHPRPPRPPLSKRYTRLFHLASQFSRSSVQQNSVPRFSSSSALATPKLFPPVAPQCLSSPHPPSSLSSPEALLMETLIHLNLHRRLLSRLTLARGNSIGERAGLGGLKAGREMLLWSACLRHQQREERRNRVWMGEERAKVPDLERPEETRQNRFPSGGEASGKPVAGLPGEDSFAVRSGGGGGGARGHSRGSSTPVKPFVLRGYKPEVHCSQPKQQQHHRRLSSLSLPSFVGGLPSLRRSFSSPLTAASSLSPSRSPSPDPAVPINEKHPFPLSLRRSFSDPLAARPSSAVSSGYSFSSEGEDNLPPTVRARLPRAVEKAVLRPEGCQAVSLSSSSATNRSKARSPRSQAIDAPYACDFTSSFSGSRTIPHPYPSPSSPSFRPSPLLPRSHLRHLPCAPCTIPLAPSSHEKRSLLPSHLVLNLGKRAGGRSGRGLEDWSKVAGRAAASVA